LGAGTAESAVRKIDPARRNSIEKYHERDTMIRAEQQGETEGRRRRPEVNSTEK
jgi:hypothetical protein